MWTLKPQDEDNPETLTTLWHILKPQEEDNPVSLDNIVIKATGRRQSCDTDNIGDIKVNPETLTTLSLKWTKTIQRH